MAYDFSKLKQEIKDTEEWLQKEFSGIRTGRATPLLLSSVRAEAYGNRMSIQELASVSVEDARTLRIIPWDKTLSKAIEKAIVDADLGVGTVADDAGIRVIFPELTAERRGVLLRLAGEKCEHARITLRGHRTEAIKELDRMKKEGGMGKDDHHRFKEEIQKHIDQGGEALDALLKKKEEEIAA